MHCLGARFGWWDDRETAIEKATAYVDRALEIDLGNADAYTTSSLILLLQRRYEEAVADARKALQLAPGSADTAELASFVLTPSGYLEEAVVQSKKPIALSPIPRCIWVLSEMPITCRGEPRKRLPLSTRTMRETPDLALPIS
jgi:adenylate cyclase